ncbi:MAG: hypothetical protein LKG79_06925 [Furfurilactobacillus sp.]|jgi:PTS system cellobiose-specific IIC component|uniref:hypothetical protein n=1 Tax=Furfurilactobacillus sp. TaxID=2767911 RepID=UPI00258D8764|nr:hypothetical protein [Furfurilactobacillus sp.]MCH4010479.1 hypothetical protein [Furfurilactobacillus sp.]MCH4036371.1 hypothetical protein [Furfurilactobacillus sp.]MCH4114683.1 hypothetical protein [Furfurilactobacillus sp.]MCH4133698.1 hypothetical protein [Furfurilactobacillus sp.]MCI1340265.1 hypothetical protein [Furfurilactobacillus sp.]
MMKQLGKDFHIRNAEVALFLRDRPMTSVIRHSLTILFPFVLMDVLLSWIDEAWLRPDGFYYQIFQFKRAGSALIEVGYSLSDLVIMLNVVVSICAAYLVGYYYAEFFHKDKMTTGLASGAAYIILNYDYRSPDNLFLFDNFGLRGLFLAFVTGIIVGLIFRIPFSNHFSSHQVVTEDDRLFSRSQRMFFPLAIVIILFVGIGFSLSLITAAGPLGILNEGIATLTLGKATTHVFAILASAVISNLLMFFGLASPIAQPRLTGFTTYSGANYQFSQAHHTSFGAPYPITLHTLYDVFGNISGVGGMLALMIAILLVGIVHRERRVAYRGLLPTLSNMSGIGLVGLPMIFNSIYLLPMLIVPVFNMLVGAVLIKSRIIPPAVYRIPWTTPGILQGYAGTGGDIATLVVAIILFFLDIIFFIPFVKNGNRLQSLLITRERSHKTETGRDQNDQ